MRYVIVTVRSLLWILTSLIALMLMLFALMSPTWLVGEQKRGTFGNETIDYQPSLGVYTRCKPTQKEFYCSLLAVDSLAAHPNVFPTVWKFSVVFICLGLSVMCVTVFTGITSCCFQSIFKKSIFTLSGAVQAFAGLCYIVGVMLHPMAWGTNRVQTLCGRNSSPFYPDTCTLGYGLWTAALGTVLTFVSACMSIPADNSTSSDKVQDQIYEGNTFICLI